VSTPATHTTEELAPVYEGELDGATFEDYLADLEELADVQRVLVKESAEARAEGTPLSLDQARMLLLTGTVRGVQIRYRHESIDWIDTLVRGTDAIRLLRVEAPSSFEAPSALERLGGAALDALSSSSDGKRRLPVPA